MTIKRLFLGMAAVLMTTMMWGQGVKPLPTLHVDGKWLVDMHGNHVVLHGVMDTPSAYFNGGRWGWSYDDAGRQRCLNYFETLFTGLEEAKCNVFRLHLEPAWTNDNNYTYPVGTKQPESEAKGEADIRHFNPGRLKNFLTTLYFPLMQEAMDHGMYVVVRPPGVCPGNLKVGDYYQEYLMEVWDIVSKSEDIQQYAGQISLELANEPVNLKNANNQDDQKALHDYFQPIVDKIRDNGFKGIIWIPGTGWQSHYENYAKYPITGTNIGYAVHDYAGWYNSSDDNPNAQIKINSFHSQVPVVDTNPIIITEVDWSPKKPGEGHFNEHGEWVEPNYGTWATASTSKWGKAYKAMLDHFGNISMTLSGTGCLIDIDKLLADGTVKPAFNGEPEACGKACMDWYAEYYEVNWPHADIPPTEEEQQTATKLTLSDAASEVMIGQDGQLQVMATFMDGHKENVASLVTCTTGSNNIIEINDGKIRGLREGMAFVDVSYTDPMGNTLTSTFKVRSTYFPFGEQYIKTDFFDNGTYNEKTREFVTGLYGQMGWEYLDGRDMSAYKYLVIKLKMPQTCGAHLNIFPTDNIWAECYSTNDFGSDTQIVVDLSEAKYTSEAKKGQPLDTKNIHIIDFWSYGGSAISVDEMYLTNNSDYSREEMPKQDMMDLSEAFKENGCVPEGWTTYDSDERRTGYSNGYGLGCRIIQLTGSSRDFDYGLYIRNKNGSHHAGYAKYGDNGNTKLQLAQGFYELDYKICNWNNPQFSPVTICVENAADGTVVASQTYTPTVNIGNAASNSFSGVEEQSFSFDILTDGDYVLAFYTADAGWADAMIGSLKLSRLGYDEENGGEEENEKGDTNGDGKVDIVDVTSTISYILGETPENFDEKAADVNEDGIINIVDVTTMIDMILGH